jgi:uncharacterized membrane protein YccF (DUF307 family)
MRAPASLFFSKGIRQPYQVRVVDEQIKDRVNSMLWTIAVILFILWLLGFSFHVAGALIHIVLVIAVILVIIRLVTGRAV